jgi:hypothetical protein
VPATLKILPLPEGSTSHPAIHYAFCHSDIVGSTVYGVDMTKLAGADINMLRSSIDLCHRWHYWTGTDALNVPKQPLVRDS